MSEEHSGDLPPVDLDEPDMAELQEVILEFLSRYEGLYEKRIQKLVFYGDVRTAEKTGERLTNASFAPYDFGPYSKAIRQALDELREDGRVMVREDGQYVTALESGDLSPKKQYLIAKIHEDTKRMSTPELVDRAKDTWLWTEFTYAEEMDFTTYVDDVLMAPEERDAIETPDRDPVEDPDLDRLLS